MTGILLGAAVGLALAAVVARTLRRRAAARERARRLAATPGRTPERPLPVASFDELDDVVETARCPCGGLLDRIGEGARPGIRVVRLVCTGCEEEVDLFFDVRALLH